MKTGIIVQARVGSTRLPAKVLKSLPFGSGVTVLGNVISRLKKVSSVNEIIIATTTSEADNPIVDVAQKAGVSIFRGSEQDVLSRYYEAAREHGLDVIVRVTSDCPCIDPAVIDKVIHMLGDGTDYVSNTLERTYPHGLDVEAFTFGAISMAHDEATDAYDREHVTPYLYRYDKFKTANFSAEAGMKRPDIRVTLDTEEDYALLSAVFDYLYDANNYFGLPDIVRLFDEKPWLAMINGKVSQKGLFSSHEQEIAEAVKLLELQGFDRAADALRKA